MTEQQFSLLPDISNFIPRSPYISSKTKLYIPSVYTGKEWLKRDTCAFFPLQLTTNSMYGIFLMNKRIQICLHILDGSSLGGYTRTGKSGCDKGRNKTFHLTSLCLLNVVPW